MYFFRFASSGFVFLFNSSCIFICIYSFLSLYLFTWIQFSCLHVRNVCMSECFHVFREVASSRRGSNRDVASVSHRFEPQSGLRCFSLFWSIFGPYQCDPGVRFSSSGPTYPRDATFLFSALTRRNKRENRAGAQHVPLKASYPVAERIVVAVYLASATLRSFWSSSVFLPRACGGARSTLGQTVR